MQKNEGAADRALDLFRESEYETKVSKFLTPQERIIVRDTLCATAGKGAERCFFWGGCRGTERCAAVFLPEWLFDTMDTAGLTGLRAAGASAAADRERFFAAFLETEEGRAVKEEIPLAAVKITGSGFRKLTHRDFMGSILALGIERNMIGDILVLTENEALVFAVDGIVPYIQSELVKIGRDGVKCRRTEIAPSYEAERAYEDMTVHVSSMRLDGIVNQLTGEGRAASAELILRGLVDQNYFTSENVSAEVKPGDIISVRGYGKFVIGEADGTTRSGRLRVHCRKYI